jgi:agmatinase
MTIDRESRSKVALRGVPLDVNSSYLRGPAEAPAAIRKAMYAGCSNLWTEDGLDLGLPDTFHDLGDVRFSGDGRTAFERVEQAAANILQSRLPLISFGGDHSVTFPILKAFHAVYPDLTILHFDAHPDLYDQLDGNRESHASPFARIMESGLARRLVQVGIRTLNAHQLEQAKRWNVEMVTMRDLGKFQGIRLEGPLYISFDVDVLDPAFAPGISHYEPGGMSVRELLAMIQSIDVYIVGADIVEYNPVRDREGQTAMVCVKILKELTAAIRRGGKVAATEHWR